MENAVLRSQGLTKRYGSKLALDNLDLTLPEGKIIGLLGPNGSGKTTFIKLAAGLLSPTAGSVTVCGKPIGPDSKAMVSYLPDKTYFNKQQKIRDLLTLFQDFYDDFDRTRAEEMLRELHIDLEAKLKTLSKGNQEKVQLILTMSRKAQLYVLDEPIAGVDPAAREFILRTILTNYNENGTVLISTHLILDVEQVLDEAVFLQQGQVVLHESTDSIRERTGGSVDELFRNMFRAPVMGNGGEYNAW